MRDPTPLKILAVWSLIPSYMLAAGLVGYGLDRWMKTFPILTAVCLLVGFGFAIRDMLKLKKELEQ